MFLRIYRLYGRWLIVVAAAAAVFLLGYAGFREYYRVAGRPRTVADVTYVTMQLFIFQSGDLDGPIGWKLQFSRFAAPLVAAYAGFYALLSLFYDRMQLVRPWLVGAHVIVCGLGRKGSRLVEQLRARGECVVVIEHNENNEQLRYCRQLGAIVLLGAANDRRTLERAYVHRAKTLISIMGDDGTNVETAVLAHELNEKRPSGVLECVVHLFDPRLQRVLKRHRIFTDTSDPFELRLFNTFEIGAHAMLGRHPVLESPDENAEPPHLLIVGMGRLGESLLALVAAEWQAQRRDSSEKLWVTAVDRRAKVKEDWIELRYPELEATCVIRYVEMDIRYPDFPRQVVLAEDDPAPPISAAYVCVDGDSLALFAALALHECLKAGRVPIIVRMTEQAGLATLLGSAPGSPGLIDGVHAVGLLDLTCSLDHVLGKPPGGAGWKRKVARG